MEFKSNKSDVIKRIKAGMFSKQVAIGELVSGTAKKLAPVDMGALRDSIDYEVMDEVVRVSANTEYAAMQEYGGEIVPKLAKSLKFQTKDGKWHNVKKVFIPAQPYLRPAIFNNASKIMKILAM